MKSIIYDFPMLGIRKYASDDDQSLLRRLAPWAGGWAGANMGGVGGLAAAYPFFDIARRHADDSMVRVGPATVGTINHPNIRRAGRIMLLASLLPAAGIGLGAYGGFKGTKSLLNKDASAGEGVNKQASAWTALRALGSSFATGARQAPKTAANLTHSRDAVRLGLEQQINQNRSFAKGTISRAKAMSSPPQVTDKVRAGMRSEAAKVVKTTRSSTEAAARELSNIKPVASGNGVVGRTRYGADAARQTWNALAPEQRMKLGITGGALAGGTAVAGTGAVLRSGGAQQVPQTAQQQIPPQNPLRFYNPQWAHMYQR